MKFHVALTVLALCLVSSSAMAERLINLSAGQSVLLPGNPEGIRVACGPGVTPPANPDPISPNPAAPGCYFKMCDIPHGEWCLMATDNNTYALAHSVEFYQTYLALQQHLRAGDCQAPSSMNCYVRPCDSPAANYCLMSDANSYSAMENSPSFGAMSSRLQEYRKAGICQ